MWLKTVFITIWCRIFSSKNVCIKLVTVAQLAFIVKILCKSRDDMKLKRLELVITSLKALIANMLSIKAWIKVIILALFDFVPIISIYFVRSYF